MRPALAAYVKDLLGHGTPYEVLPFAAAADVLAEAIAGTLTAGPGTDTDPAPQQWGEFLVAGLYVRHVLDLPPVQGLAEARRLGEAVPRDLRGVLDLDLARPAPGLNVQVLRAVARALAFAEGSGMPEQVAQHAAAAFLPSPEHPAGLGSGETRKALDRLRFYLRRDVDLDGSTLYRLFHQGLADQLRADAAEDATVLTGHGPAARVWRHLYAMIPAGRGRVAAVAARRALPAAARRPARRRRRPARRPAPGRSVPHPRRPGHPGPAACGPARGRRRRGRRYLPRLLRLTLPAAPAARAQILAVDAARYGNPDLAQRLSSAAVWQPVWATSQSRSAGLRLTLTGHTGVVFAVAVGRAGDRDVIVSGSDDGTVRVWDAATGQPVGQPLTGHTGGVSAVAVGRAGDRDVIVSGGGGRHGAGLGRGHRAAGRPAADRPHRRGVRGGGGPGRGPRRDRLRRRRTARCGSGTRPPGSRPASR